MSAWWLRLKAWYWRWQLARQVSQLPPLEELQPPPVAVDDAALGALVAALQATGAVAHGAALGVTLNDQQVWLWATDPDALAALREKAFLGGQPSALLAAWEDEEGALIRVYAALRPRAFRDLVAAMRAAH